MTSAEATKDVQDAINAGFDGFALNTHTVSSTDTWNTDAISYLLNAAQGTSFKMFLSFDMSWGLDVSSLPAFLLQYSNNSAYYTVGGKPFVSTYTGGTISNDEWDSSFRQPLVAQGVTPYFVPDFDDTSGYPTGFFDTYTTVDGAFSWESAWPAPGTTISNVTDSEDATMVQEAHAAGKVYMMRELFLSSLKFHFHQVIEPTLTNSVFLISCVHVPIQILGQWTRLVPYRRGQSTTTHPTSAGPTAGFRRSTHMERRRRGPLRGRLLAGANCRVRHRRLRRRL